MNLAARSLQKSVALFATIMMSGFLLAMPSLTQAQAEKKASAQPEWSGVWKPPEPNQSGWDWVRLKSNEWVKGEILLMRNFDLHFDSDEFGVVTLDWLDVAEIRTERVYIFVLQDMETSHSGTMTMRGDKISVRVGDKIERFDRSQLLAITPNANREFNLWSMHASFGVGLRSGNTDQSDLTGRMNLNREGKNTRFRTEYNGAYGSLANEKNTNNHRAGSAFDYSLTRDLFLTPIAFEVFTDEFQNVSYRLTPTVGIGYFLVRRPSLDWEVRFGGGYQHTRTDSVAPGDGKTSDNGAITLATSLDTELNSRVDLIVEYQLQLITPDIDQTNHHSEVTFEIELTSAIDLDVSFIWDRIEGPEAEADGEKPETDDFRLSVGLAVEF